MGFFQRIANTIRGMMQGRYGFDQLGRVLLYVSLALVLAGSLSRLGLLTILGFAVLIYCYYRFLSKDIDRRYQENQRFVSWYTGVKNRFAERKTHRFFRCPRCRVVVRVPKGKGKIRITCPKCGEEFNKQT